MAAYDGFDHNAHTLRLLTKLERRHARFGGVNLTWEALEGVVKHNGPLTGPNARKSEPLPAAIVEYAKAHDLWLGTYASLEAQVAAIADDIAYNNHDVDDGLRAGLFSFEAARDLPLAGEAFRRVEKIYPDAPRDIVIAEAVSDLIGAMIGDVVAQTRARLDDLKPKDADAIRHAGRQIVDFSPSMKEQLTGLRAFLHENVYRHYKVNCARSQAKRVVRALFDLYIAEPETLPPQWRASGADQPRSVCDYIAGMTDRYAMREHERLFSGAPLI
jgi:dGTPase